MKAIGFISLLVFLLAFVPESYSQDQPPQRRIRQRASETATDNTPSLTERAIIKNEESSKAPSHVVWQREIYRNIHLDHESNSPLYYPTRAIGNRVNLFTLIFNLLAEGKIKAYNYLDGREIFTEEQRINFEEDVLKKYQLLYSTQGSGNNIKYIVDENDIPGAEVLIYLIKEGWYFDAATGTFKSQVIAISPMLVREDFYSGERTRDPLFWLAYEEIRPYLSRELIMTSNYNNTLTYTMDDYFSKRMYSGEIVKTTNLMNLSLAQQVGADPDSLKKAQDSIENQLKNFNKSLWVYNDTIPAAAVAEADKPDKKTTKSNEKTSGRGAKKEKEEKPKATSSKAEKSSSAPVRSVRRR
jgi:gliding motility associated protien GldN